MDSWYLISLCMLWRICYIRRWANPTVGYIGLADFARKSQYSTIPFSWQGLAMCDIFSFMCCLFPEKACRTHCSLTYGVLYRSLAVVSASYDAASSHIQPLRICAKAMIRVNWHSRYCRRSGELIGMRPKC